MELYKKAEYYKIIGLCMEIHRILGGGLAEVIYKDALEIEFKAHNIPYEREKAYPVTYKNHRLGHSYFADFVVYDDIILEVKATKYIANEHITQTINYIILAKTQLGIIANFNIKTLQHQRIKV
jgi:GxxExxY protein